MALTLTARTSGQSAVSATSYATASISPTASALLLILVGGQFASGTPALPTVSSPHSLTVSWTQVAAYAYDNVGIAADSIALWAAITGATPGSGAITVSYGAQTQFGSSWSVVDITGGQITGGVGPGSTAAIVQAVTGTLNPPNATGGTLTLAAAAISANRPFAGWVQQASLATTPRASWTEIHDVVGNRGLETEWRSDAFETTASATWTNSVQWGGIAVELAVDVVSATLAATLPAIVAAAAGQVTASATLAATMPSIVAAAAGQATASAGMSATMPALVVAAGAFVRQDLITTRPNTGTTARPSSGTTTRPNLGITPRP